MKILRRVSVGLVTSFMLLSAGLAQDFMNMKFLTVSSKISPEKVSPGMTVNLSISVTIAPGFHINSHQPTEPYLIPTVVKFEPMDHASFSAIHYSDPKLLKFSFSEEPLSVYEGTIDFLASLTLSDQFPIGTSTIKGSVSYQACNDNNCFAPTSEPFEIPIEVVPGSVERESKPFSQIATPKEPNQTERIETAVIEQPTASIAQPSVPTTSRASAPVAFTSDELKAKQVIEKGLPYALLAFFIFGLALNLTPCVYPVIPLTVGYFGVQSGKCRGSSFVMALFYVIGIALIFAALGLISGLAGKQWGFLFQNPWFVVAVTVIILAMAASMFGAFEITVPAWLSSSLGKSREGTIGALIMGLTVGVVIAPCAAGIIIGLVGLVAKLGIVAKGTLLFFVMGLGLGVPYLILATFSSLLSKLPQSGMWMVWIRKLFGVLLIGVALYFFLPQARHVYDQLGFFFGLLAIFGGLLLGFLDHAPGYTRAFKIARAIFGLAMIVFGIFLTNRAIHAKPSELNWVHYTDQSLAELQTEGKPIFIDFYADWCAPCKEMDRTTFRDERVIEISKQLTMVKVDCTAPDENIKRFMQQFSVTGMPTLVFITADGQEQMDMREIGYLGPDRFIEKIDRLLQKR
ncbi:MAG: thioredoxin family protein [candidate division KSB1 bacterium]|nr:thioredoxin family protein [candidate division KSB1 bacterium]